MMVWLFISDCVWYAIVVPWGSVSDCIRIWSDVIVSVISIVQISAGDYIPRLVDIFLIGMWVFLS